MATIHASYPLDIRYTNKKFGRYRLWKCAAQKLCQQGDLPVFRQNSNTPIPGARAVLRPIDNGIQITAYLPGNRRSWQQVKSVSLWLDEVDGLVRDELVGEEGSRYTAGVVAATSGHVKGVTLMREQWGQSLSITD
jgi:hypothetical protein